MLQIVILGSAVLAFAAFATYMDLRSGGSRPPDEPKKH